MKKVTELVAALAQPIVERHGCELWDVEFQREAGQWYLRIYIDRPEGVDIALCEAVSRELDGVLDAADPIEQSYIFEVSSAGADRQLKRPSDFERFMGAKVDVKLYQAEGGAKLHTGVLRRYSQGDVTIETPGGTMTYGKNNIAVVKLTVEF